MGAADGASRRFSRAYDARVQALHRNHASAERSRAAAGDAEAKAERSRAAAGDAEAKAERSREALLAKRRNGGTGSKAVAKASAKADKDAAAAAAARLAATAAQEKVRPVAPARCASSRGAGASPRRTRRAPRFGARLPTPLFFLPSPLCAQCAGAARAMRGQCGWCEGGGRVVVAPRSRWATRGDAPSLPRSRRLGVPCLHLPQPRRERLGPLRVLRVGEPRGGAGCGERGGQGGGGDGDGRRQPRSGGGGGEGGGAKGGVRSVWAGAHDGPALRVPTLLLPRCVALGHLTSPRFALRVRLRLAAERSLQHFCLCT